ncbi:MAG: PKD domain-containing protein [Bacteroidia bacterium]|nr:PKD domain-containing protein [Bacteroidia bacterium]
MKHFYPFLLSLFSPFLKKGKLHFALLLLFLSTSHSLFSQGFKIHSFLGNRCNNQSFQLVFTYDTLNAPTAPIIAELSDAAGIFNPIPPSIGSISSLSGGSDTITCSFSGIPAGSNYRIRIKSNNSPPWMDTSSSFSISIPTVSFTFTNNNACAGAVVLFSNTSTGVGSLSCNWDFGTNPGSPGTSTLCFPGVSFSPPPGGGSVNYTVALTVTDGQGCKASTTNIVTVKQNPNPLFDTANVTSTATFDHSQNLFIGDCSVTMQSPNFNFVIGNTSTTSSSITSYSINWGDGTANTILPNFVTTSHLYTQLGLFNINLTATAVNGCQFTKTYQFFNGNSPSGNLTTIPNINDCVPYTITWQVDTSTTNSNPPGTTYTFEVNDGSPIQNFTQSTLPTSISHTFTVSSCSIPPSNSFTIKFTPKNPCQPYPTTFTARPSQKPVASFTINPSNTICTNTNVSINNTSIGNYFIGSTCFSNFEKYWFITPATGWTLLSGQLAPSPTAINGSNNLSLSFQQPGNYQIKLRIVRSNSGGNLSRCFADSAIQTICVQPIPIPSFTLNVSPSSNCKPTLVSAANTSNTLSSCATPVYTWTIRDSSTTGSTPVLPGTRFIFANGTDSNSLNPSFQFLQKGRYIIRLRISNTCPGNFFKDTLIIIRDIPVVGLRPDIIYCGPQSLSFSSSNPAHVATYDSSFSPINSYAWSISPASGYSFVSGNASSPFPTIQFTNTTNLPITYRLILTATNACGVSNPDTQNITINPKPIVTANSLNPAFCSGGTAQITLSHNLAGGVLYGWRAYPSSPNISGFSNSSSPVSGPINQTLFNSGSTTETVTYKIAASQSSTNCFGDSSSVVVTVYPIPKVQAIAQAICSGATLSLPLNSTVSGALFTWTANSKASLVSGFSNNPTPAPGPILHTLINSSNSTVDTVRYTIRASANGCNSPDTLIQIRVSPTPVVSASNQTLCSGTQLGLNASSSVAGSSFAYTAQLISGTATGFGGGTSIPINQTLTNTGTTPALIRYSLSTTSPAPAFCPSAPVLIDVTVQPKPALSVSSTSTICSGSSTSINLSSNVTNTLYRYNATLVSGSSTFGFYSKTTDTLGPISQTLFNNGSTNAVVRYFITPRIGNCSGDSVQHEVTIIPGPIPGTIGSMGPFCSGNNAFNLQLSGSSGTIVRWEKSVAPFTSFDPIANTNAILPQSGLTQTTKYRVVINTGAGGACGSVTTPEVTVQIDSISLGGTLSAWDTVCTGTNSGNLTLSGSRGQIQSWQSASNPLGSWTNISGTANQSNYTFSNLSNTTWYKVLVKNGVCPSAISDSVRILVDQQPSNALAFDTSFCLLTAGIPITGFVRAQAISIGNGNWQFLSGPSSSSVSSPQLLSTPISNLLQGDYYFTWRVSNGKCPSKVDTAKVSIYPPLQSSIGSEQTICQGQTAATLTGLATSGGTGTYTYQWEQSTNNIIYTNINGATLSNYSPGALSSSTWFRRITRSGTCVHISSSVKITVLPSIGGNSISADQAYCIGNTSNPITGSSPTGGDGTFKYQWQRFSGGTWVNAGGADTLQNYAPGALSQTTQFRRLVTSNVCSGAQQSISNSVTHTVYPLPVVQAGADIIKCNNQPKFKLLGNPLSGTWSGPQPIVADSIDPTQYALGTYSLIYTYTNSNGCTNRDTLNFTVIAPPVVDAGSNFSICQNSPAVQLSGFNPAGGTWSGPGVSSGGLFNPSTAGAGTKQLIYSFTAGSGCNGTDTLLIMVQPKPDPGFILPVRACALDTILLSATSNPSANLASLVWSLSNNGGMSNAILGSTTAANTQAIFPENQGNTDITYTVKLIQVTNQGCSDSISKTIVHLRRPLAQFNTGAAINCGPASYSILNTTSNVASTYLWSVNPTGNVSIVTPTAANPQVNLPVNTSNAQISYQLQLIATRNTGDLGCRDTAIANLIVYPKPQAAFTLSPNAAGCSPLPVTFTNASNPKNGESINEMSFSWTFGGLAADTNRDQSRTFFNRGGIIDSLYTVRLIATSKWGCKDTLSNTVTVYPFPKADFSASVISNCAPFAIGSSVISLNQYPIANDTYTWHILDKAHNILSTSSGTSIPSHTLNQPNDTVYYRLITSNVHGCKPDTLTRMFRTIENPKALFSLSDSVGCHPLNINLTSQSTVGVNHSWNFGNGATSTTINPSQNFINTSFTKDTTYFVRLVVTAGTGCRDTLIKPLTVYPKPLAAFSISPQACAKSVVSVVNSSQHKGSFATWNWSRMSPTQSLLQASDSTLREPQFALPDNQGTSDSSYTLRLRVTSLDGCSADTFRSFTGLRRPLAGFNLPNPTCGPVLVNSSNTTSNVGASFQWTSQPSGVSISNPNATSPSFSFPLNGSADSLNYRITLLAISSTGNCRDSIGKTVTVYPKPIASFSSNALDSCGPRRMEFINNSDPRNGEDSNSMTWNWSYLGKQIFSKHAADTFRNSGVVDSIYAVRLIVTSQHGCKDSTSKDIRVRPDAKAQFSRSISISCAPFQITSSIISTSIFPEANSSYEWYANQSYLGSGSTFPGFNLANQADSVLIKLKVLSKNGCKHDSMSLWFYTIENPKPNFIAIDSVSCSGKTVQFTNLSTPTSGLAYTWQFGSSAQSSNQSNPSFSFTNSGNLDTTVFIKLITLAGGTGCKDSLIKSIVIKPLPNPDFQLSDSVNCYPSPVLATISSGNQPPINPSTYRWVAGPTGISLLNDTASASNSFQFTDNQSGNSNVYWVRLKVASNFGCIDSISKALRIPSRPIASFVFNPGNGCGPFSSIATSNSSFGTSYTWKDLSQQGTVNNPSASSTGISYPVHRGNLDSIYALRLIVRSNEGCLDSISKTVTVHPKPIARFVVDTSSGCAPLHINFSSNSIVKKPASLNWNFGDGSAIVISSNDSSSHTYLGSKWQDTSYTSRLIIQSADGCKDTVYKSIFVQSGAYADIVLPDTQLCSSKLNPASLLIQNKSYGSVDTFYWDFGDGQQLITTSDSAIRHPYNQEGYYKITLRAKNDCRESFDSAYVLVQTPARVQITKSDSVGCSPMKVSFTNLSTDTFRAQFYWNMGNGNTYSSFQIPEQTYLQSAVTDTFYYIRHTISNVCGSFSILDTVRVLPLPTSYFLTNTDSGCSPLAVTVLNLSYGVPQTYNWDFGNGYISTRRNPNPDSLVYRTLDTPTVYLIKLVVSNICGSDSSFKRIKVMPNTVNSFFTADVQNGCDALTVRFTDYSSGGQNLSWNFGDGTGSTAKNPSHTFTQPGIYRVSQFVNNNCSFDTSSVLIQVYPSPAFSIAKQSKAACMEEPVQFSATLTDPGTLIWYFGDGDSSFQQNPTHRYTTSGIKIIKAVMVSALNSCTKTLWDTLLINPLPGATIIADTSRACQNEGFHFMGTTQTPAFLQWDFGDGSFGNGNSVSHYFNQAGSFSIRLVATSAAGCSDTAQKIITVYPAPDASFVMSPRDTCNGPAWVNFTNTSPGANTYLWQFHDGSSSSSINERKFYSGLGSYAIRLIATNGFLCKDSAIDSFAILDKPVAAFDFTPEDLCEGESVQFNNQSLRGKRFTWYFGDGDSSQQENPSHRYLDSGEYRVRLIAYAGSVCLDSLTASKTVKVHPKPRPSMLIQVDSTEKPVRTVSFAYTGTHGKRVSWNFGDGSESQGNQVMHKYTYGYNDSCFNVSASILSDYGCDTLLVQRICLPAYKYGLFVPNAFTPDHGIAEVREFKPVGKEIKTYHLRIFTKWGELVFESTELADGSPAKGWDGRHKDSGVSLDQGSYIWTIEAVFTNEQAWDGMLFPGASKKVKVGNVTLIR